METLKSQARNQDILIDFGSQLFDKLDRIAIALENFTLSNESMPVEEATTDNLGVSNGEGQAIDTIDES